MSFKGKKQKGGAVAKLLVALVELHSVGIERPSKKDVGHRAGVNPDSSTMRNACAYFKREGLVDTSDSKTLMLTPKGHDEARTMVNIQLPKSNAEFHDKFRAALGNSKSVKIFDLLLESSVPLTKEQIGQGIDCDISKSTFRNAMAPLNKLELLEQLGGKTYRLSDKCFPLGRNHVVDA